MTYHATSTVRAATRDDAPFLARMIDIAGDGIPTWLWAQSAEPGEEPLDVGTARACREAGGFSYRNALVAERGGVPTGMMLGYRIEAPTDADRAEVATLPAPVRPFVELEHEAPGTFYINALAVCAAARGEGIGTRLLQAAEGQARSAGIGTMSIQVFSQNLDAVRLYTRLGYRTVTSRPVLDHPCPPFYDEDVLLMTKPLAAG